MRIVIFFEAKNFNFLENFAKFSDFSLISLTFNFLNISSFVIILQLFYNIF